MQLNKKTASLLAVSSVLLGSIGAIGLQAHAQQKPAVNQPAQIQTQASAADTQENSAVDKDNVQDQMDNGKPDSAKESALEGKDGAEANENLPGGGHQDQDGVNADHQFEGVE